MPIKPLSPLDLDVREHGEGLRQQDSVLDDAHATRAAPSRGAAAAT